MNIVTGYNDNPIQPETATICRFYIKGMCRFGNRCRNIHDNTPQKAKSPEKPKSGEKGKTPQSYGKFNSPGSSSRGSSGSSASKTKKKLSSEFSPSTSSSAKAVLLVQRAQSIEKTCGICFDTILEKTNRKERTFGILPNCNHCFCFTCLRKWRQSKEFDFEVSKACPECRTSSDYVYPSRFWLEAKEEKESFISKEKSRMQKIDCRYFKKGSGTCPFGNTCLYLHALPNGKVLDVGPPKPRRRRTSHLDHELIHQILFWLNDDDLDIDDDDDDDFDFEPDDLDLDDPYIAMQYYDHDDIFRYIAMDRAANSDNESDDLGFFF